MSTSKTNNKSRFDPLDQMIFEDGLRIRKLFFDKATDLMLVVLNNGAVLQEPISRYSRLKNASEQDLQNYEISRTGVHWEHLDEDLSLRGFLKNAMHSSFQRKEA